MIGISVPPGVHATSIHWIRDVPSVAGRICAGTVSARLRINRSCGNKTRDAGTGYINLRRARRKGAECANLSRKHRIIQNLAQNLGMNISSKFPRMPRQLERKHRKLRKWSKTGMPPTAERRDYEKHARGSCPRVPHLLEIQS